MTRVRARTLLTIPILSLLVHGVAHAGDDGGHKASAERFLRGVYACDPEAVEELAAEDIVISYPIFEEVFGSPALRGRESALEYTRRFCSRWADPEFTLHEVVADGNRVVILWSYQARSIAPGPGGEPPTNELHRWGGITLYRFDDEGKITLEVGEESDPGPFGRLSADAK